MKALGDDEPMVDIGALIGQARDAHRSIRGESRAALERAFEAGRLLIEIKTGVPTRGMGRPSEGNGHPPFHRRLYMQLYRERDRINAAGCMSIRQARDFLSGAAARRSEKRRQQAESTTDDRYNAGYADGYRDGLAKGRAEGLDLGYDQGLKDGSKASTNGTIPLSKTELRWALKQLHPDRFEANGSKAAKGHAKRVTQWLNDLMASAK